MSVGKAAPIVTVHALPGGWFGAEVMQGEKRIALSPPTHRSEASAREWARRFIKARNGVHA